MAFKVYTRVNMADTMRDPDDIRLTDVGYKNKLADAITLANDYINNHFFKKDIRLKAGEGKIIYRATDFCSYGATIIIEEINIS